jgi:hypothetical protein
MPEKAVTAKRVSEKNTKQEVLDAYLELVKQVEEKRQAELNPERRIEEKKAEEALKAAGSVVAEGIDREIGSLKSEIGKMLADVSEKLGAEALRFRNLEKAVQTKEQELRELYGIEKAAATLAALIEGQNRKRQEFDTEMTQHREELQREIDETRLAWQKERQAHDAELRDREATEKKARDREKEQFDYAFKRDQQTLRDKLNDEKGTLEKELKLKKETADKDFADRERVLVERETELNALRARAAAFPKELETAVEKAVKEATEKVRLEAKNREDLLKKEFEGERNVLTARTQGQDKAVKELAEQNTRLNTQLEAAYKKVQEIAEKTIESAGHAKALADLQKLLVEQGRKTSD